MGKEKSRFILAVIIFGLVGQIAWVVENMYFNVFIYKMFNASASNISLMVGASSVVATITTLIIGALSDKIGKRKVFICGGYIVWGISILGFSILRLDIIRGLFPYVAIETAMAIGVTLVIIFDCIMTFFGSSANDACFNAWLTDSTDSTNRGKIEGINSMMPLVAILVVFGGFMGFDLNKTSSWTIIFIIIGVIVIAIGILGIFIIKDSSISTEENKQYFKNIIYGFRPSVVKENYRLYLYLIAFAIFGVAIQIFMPYLIIYYEVSLQMTDYVLIMAPAIILASAFTFIYGRMYDKWRFNKSIIVPISLLILGFVILYIFKGKALVFIGSLFMMCGYLSGAAVFGAVIRDNTPINKSGMFQGLRIVAQVLVPGIIGPMIGSMILADAKLMINNDGTTSFIPNQKIFMGALIVTLVLVVALLVIIYFIRKKKEVNVK